MSEQPIEPQQTRQVPPAQTKVPQEQPAAIKPPVTAPDTPHIVPEQQSQAKPPGRIEFFLPHRKATYDPPKNADAELDPLQVPNEIVKNNKKTDEEKINDFERLFNAFARSEKLKDELQKFEKGEEFTPIFLKGFIPKPLVGTTIGGIPTGPPWKPSDTFFTDYKIHNPPERILSESDTSYIICNNAAHDTRLYTEEVDASGQDKRAVAGMSYMHLLVIPKERIYNAVTIEDPAVITEYIEHFTKFWKEGYKGRKPVAIVNEAIEFALEKRISDLEKTLVPVGETKAEESSGLSEEEKRKVEAQMKRRESVPKAVNDARQSAKEMAARLQEFYNSSGPDTTGTFEVVGGLVEPLPPKKSRKPPSKANTLPMSSSSSQSKTAPLRFAFAFHAHPFASVGHIHMHVILESGPSSQPGGAASRGAGEGDAARFNFKRYSTGAHDWKSIRAVQIRAFLERKLGQPEGSKAEPMAHRIKRSLTWHPGMTFNFLQHLPGFGKKNT
ncbi:hypothetical protein ONZ45_g18645 [Pleurotus djamor]|nr:hypothetical protein ONZ45_g18645 [Pleurotus djamor]